MQPLGYRRRCYRFIGLDHGDELDRRNDKCEGIRELAWYPSSYSSTRKFATSEVGPKMRLRLLSAHHTAHLRNCKLYDWADLDRQDCCRSLAAKRKLLENLSRRQATWLVEGRSPLEHLLGLWIRSKAGVSVWRSPTTSLVVLGTRLDPSTLVLLAGGMPSSGLYRLHSTLGWINLSTGPSPVNASTASARGSSLQLKKGSIWCVSLGAYGSASSGPNASMVAWKTWGQSISLTCRVLSGIPYLPYHKRHPCLLW